MADHKSALKRARQNIIRRQRNRMNKTRVKSIIKDVRAAVTTKASEDAVEKLNMAKSIIQKAAKKGIIHKKHASRKISRLSKLVNTITA